MARPVNYLGWILLIISVRAAICLKKWEPPASTKGLYSGVACHRPYNCLFEDDPPFKPSELVGQFLNVAKEKSCQELCQDKEGCVSYTWLSGNAENTPLLCQLFSRCRRSYQDPDLSTVFSGPP